MEKIIRIDDRDVKFKSTAGTPIRYKMQFKSEMMDDLQSLNEKMQEVKVGKASFSFNDLRIFEQIAWAMVKTADPNTPPMENWLDDFEMFSIYTILPELEDLILANFKSTDGQKKNIIPQEIQKEQN